MKKSLAAAFLVSALALPALADEPQDRDPGVTRMIDLLSAQFEEATGKPFDKETREDYRLGLTTSLYNNIREGTCREVIYSVHKDGHDLRVHEDICRIDDNFVRAPEHLRAIP